MKPNIKPKCEDIFKNVCAKDYYNLLIKNSDICEYGIDCNGKIYFAYINGNIERYSRIEFIREAKAYFETSYYVHLRKD